VSIQINFRGEGSDQSQILNITPTNNVSHTASAVDYEE
jgi:hypothetical protein